MSLPVLVTTAAARCVPSGDQEAVRLKNGPTFLCRTTLPSVVRTCGPVPSEPTIQSRFVIRWLVADVCQRTSLNVILRPSGDQAGAYASLLTTLVFDSIHTVCRPRPFAPIVKIPDPRPSTEPANAIRSAFGDQASQVTRSTLAGESRCFLPPLESIR